MQKTGKLVSMVFVFLFGLLQVSCPSDQQVSSMSRHQKKSVHVTESELRTDSVNIQTLISQIKDLTQSYIAQSPEQNMSYLDFEGLFDSPASSATPRGLSDESVLESFLSKRQRSLSEIFQE